MQYVAAVSRTGHISLYGPFNNVAECWAWAQKNLPGWEPHQAGSDPRGTWQSVWEAPKS